MDLLCVTRTQCTPKDVIVTNIEFSKIRQNDLNLMKKSPMTKFVYVLRAQFMKYL